jgi:hypothetical protein
VLADGSPDVAVGTQDVDSGDVDPLHDAGGVDQEHGLHERVEDGPDGALGIERSV